ncbi:MAG: class I SAM-dependent methyltransferase [Deltaproteobacteria bacterium]|nr:class I SAM-dependent methyltransferase [Deltaproteobacteria bacterium]
MDILTGLDRKSDYSRAQLQLIFGTWVLTSLMEGKKKISASDGDVLEGDYDKRSVYALLYALYRSMGEVRSETGERYEATFNTWGYAWPAEWGPSPTKTQDPQRFGRNAYTGLFQAAPVKEHLRRLGGRVHVVEMGCGTGAGAHHVCSSVLPDCTYEAVDMQHAAIETCKRKFVPDLGGRLKATCSDATDLSIGDCVADLVAVNETHVTERVGQVTDEDQRFFRTARRLLKPEGLLVWGNAIPDATWRPCFELLESIGMKVLEVRDVTSEAVQARDEDKPRIDAYADQCAERIIGFRIPFVGKRKRIEAASALKNFCRNPGTRMYENMRTRVDTYKVVVAQRVS